MKRKYLLKMGAFLVASVMLLSMLSGCISEKKEETPAPTTTAAPEKKHYKIGIMPFHTGCMWFDPFTAAGKWWLEAHGHEVIVANAEWDTQKMNTILMAWARDPDLDGVIIAPLGGQEVMPGIKALHDAGKAVILANNDAGYCPEAILEVEFGSYEANKAAAEKIVEMLTEKYGEPKGTIILGLGDIRTPEHVRRADGYRDVFKQYPNIEVYEIETRMTADQAMTKTSDLLRSLPTVDAVVSVGMLEFMGMINALKRENKAYPVGDPNHIICVGMDTCPSVINPAVKEGIVDFVVDQPVLAYTPLAAYYLVKYLDEGPSALPKAGDTITPADVNIKVKPPYEGMDFYIPSDAWAPAEVVDTMDKFGHLWVKTNYRIVDKSNVDDPTLWSVITQNITDWGF